MAACLRCGRQVRPCAAITPSLQALQVFEL